MQVITYSVFSLNILVLGYSLGARLDAEMLGLAIAGAVNLIFSYGLGNK